MGCWNKTCGISNLHIKARDEVYCFVIEQTRYHERCYSTAFWRPVILPFTTRYNEYGGGENSSENLNYILAGIKKDMVEMELGENPYHDIEVKKDKLDEELFFEAVHEGRLFIKKMGEDVPVDFVMLRKDVVDSIIEKLTLTRYVGGGNGTCGYDNNYIEYNFKDVLNDVDDCIERIKVAISSDDFRIYLGIDSIFNYNDPNMAAMYLRSISNYKYSSIVYYKELLFELIHNGEIEQAKKLMIDLLLGIYIDSFFEMTRRNWAPGGHEGSQSQSHKPYIVLHDSILEALQKEKAYYEEMNGEYYDDDDY